MNVWPPDWLIIVICIGVSIVIFTIIWICIMAHVDGELENFQTKAGSK